MSGAEFAGSFLVSVEGRPLPSDLETLLTSAWVESNQRLPAMFVLRFRDPDRVVVAKSGLAIGSRVTVGAATAGATTPQPLVSGEVTALEAELDGVGSVTVVRGYDQSHRLRRGSSVAAYLTMTYSAIAERVAKRAGLRVGTITPTRAVLDHVPQDNLDDWTFLDRLAREIGYVVTVADGALDFCLPADAQGAPAPSGPGTDPRILRAGEDLLGLRVTVSAAEQIPQVEVRSWNALEKVPVRATATAQATNARLPLTPGGLAATFGAPPLVSTHRPYQQQAEADQAAAAVAEQVASGFAELEGVVRGDPQLRAGMPVALDGLGAPFDGRYTLSHTRHVFDPDEGYTTQISVTGRQERSLLGLATGGASGTGGGVGIAVGVVSDVRDPQQLGRVKLRLPWLADDYVTDWAPTVQLGAGAGRGWWVLPEVNDQVLVGFELGDVRRPFVLGGLHSSADQPPSGAYPVDSGSGAIVRRAFVTRTGHAVEFDEQDAAARKGVTILTGDDKLKVQLDSQATRIAVTSDGTVVIEAARGVQVRSTSGAVELSGRTIALKAQAGATIDGGAGNVDVQSNAELALTGASASLQGRTAVAVQGGTQASVKAPIVMIN